MGAAVGVATAAAAAAAAKAKVLNRRCTIAGSAAARSSSSRFLQRNLAPDLKGAFHFDPLGLASVEPELKIHPAALVAVVASTFPADVSAAVPSYVSQEVQVEEELLLVAVVAALCFSGESAVVFSQVWNHLQDRDSGIHPGAEWVAEPVCYPVDMECDVCERNDAWSEYYGEEIWLCSD